MRIADPNYERAFVRVRDVIHEWDPYDLIHGGAPADERDREIFLLVSQLPNIKSVADAADAISRVFSQAFQPEGFTPSDCADVGRRLFSAIKELS